LDFCPGPASDWDPPTYASHVVGITGIATTPNFLIEMGHENFCPGWH
jgi:hypothetical protein